MVISVLASVGTVASSRATKSATRGGLPLGIVQNLASKAAKKQAARVSKVASMFTSRKETDE